MPQTIPIQTGVSLVSANGSPATAPEAMLLRAHRILSGDVRQDDYLSMTDEVRQSLALSEAYIRDERKGELVGEARLEHVHYLLLIYHYGGKCVASYSDTVGVAVLAVGDEIRELLPTLSKEQLLRICVESPEEW